MTTPIEMCPLHVLPSALGGERLLAGLAHWDRHTLRVCVRASRLPAWLLEEVPSLEQQIADLKGALTDLAASPRLAAMAGVALPDLGPPMCRALLPPMLDWGHVIHVETTQPAERHFAEMLRLMRLGLGGLVRAAVGRLARRGAAETVDIEPLLPVAGGVLEAPLRAGGAGRRGLGDVALHLLEPLARLVALGIDRRRRRGFRGAGGEREAERQENESSEHHAIESEVSGRRKRTMGSVQRRGLRISLQATQMPPSSP